MNFQPASICLASINTLTTSSIANYLVPKSIARLGTTCSPYYKTTVRKRPRQLPHPTSHPSTFKIIDTLMMISSPHPEQFLYATTTLLDAVLVNGHGELAYVTQTSGSLTTLFRLDTLTGGLKRVSTIKWAHGSSRPFVTVYDVKYGTMLAASFCSSLNSHQPLCSASDNMMRQKTKQRGPNPPFPLAHRYILNWP